MQPWEILNDCKSNRESGEQTFLGETRASANKDTRAPLYDCTATIARENSKIAASFFSRRNATLQDSSGGS